LEGREKGSGDGTIILIAARSELDLTQGKKGERGSGFLWGGSHLHGKWGGEGIFFRGKSRLLFPVPKPLEGGLSLLSLLRGQGRGVSKKEV